MSQENVEVVRTFYDETAEGRFWTCGHLFDPDVEYERRRKPADMMTGRWRGLEAMSAALLEWFETVEDLRIEAERYIDTGGDSVVVFTRHRSVAKTSGVPIDEEFADVLTVREGRIVRLHTYRHRAEALEAVGLRE
jgi:ketosteroid isomerase-like protein